MGLIRMNSLAELYILCKPQATSEEKEQVIDGGVDDLLMRLKRYRKNEDLLKCKCDEAFEELKAILDRFYHHDKVFAKLILAKAGARLRRLELQSRQRGG